MTKKIKDPFYKREKQKYEFPIPSREVILQLLAEMGRPISLNKLISNLDITTKQREAFGFRLKAMLRDGQIMEDRRGRYCLIQKTNLQKGRVQGHPEGYGFFIPDDGSEDMLLSAKEMHGVMHGDIVLAYQAGIDRRGRLEAKIHEILDHANKTIVGRYFTEFGVGFLVPNNTRITQEIIIPLTEGAKAKNGQIVLAEVIAFPSKKNQAIGKIIHILGEHMAPGMEIEMAIHTYDIPSVWNEKISQEVAEISQSITSNDLVGREDLRTYNFVTIDGEDAKDFDDAVFCIPITNGFKLFVAIADVSHYVARDTFLDKEAKLRGNSVYFPGKVVPMLPEELSNGICSLNPNVDRLCFTAELNINKDGKLQKSKFYKSVIKSFARLTYTQVDNHIKNKKPFTNEKISTNIDNLYKLFKILNKARKSRGAMDFDSIETKIEFDENRKINKIIPLVRNEAHCLIEECMLMANIAAAQLLKKAKVPSLYRVHTSPSEEKINALRLFLGELGLNLPGGKKPKPQDFQKILYAIEKRPEKHIIEMIMLRSLKQAKYSEKNEGHFGLAYPAYTHFTSPIRRYPDLLVHRILEKIIDNDAVELYTIEEMHLLGNHCSITERRADEATRDVVAWLKCEYMQDKIGQVFEGAISSVTSFGIFVELKNIYVEGLVHITTLRNDYYRFDPIKHRLIGERTGLTFRLGDIMKVLVARVDLDERKIDFEPMGYDLKDE